MSNQTKMNSDVLDLMIYNEIEGLDLITCLITLKVLLENINKTNIVEDLEIK